MKFFNYCFYRISKAYSKWEPNIYHISGMAVVNLCQLFNLMSLITIIFIILKIKFPPEFILYIGLPIFIISNFFISSEKKYLQLAKKWENENPKYIKLKGYLILLYVLLSLVIYALLLYIMYNM